MSRRFEGKVAIVTGASRGIGRATSIQIALEGAKVVCTARSIDGEETVNCIKTLGGEAIFVKCDVTIESDIRNVVEQAMRTYGQIDCVYNNAAITGGKQMLIEDYDLDTFHRVYNTNVDSQFLMMHYAAPHMKSGGSIVNCSSLHGTIGMAGDIGYSSSKHAIPGLTRTAAAEFGSRNIRVNSVHPGPVPTKMMRDYEGTITDNIEALEDQIAKGTALKRFGREEEIAKAVCFLLSDDASYITGHPLMVDGGWGIAT